MVLENDYMIYNVAFSRPITIKRISTANTFPYGSCVKESYRQETNFIRKSYFYTGVVFFFFFFREGGCVAHTMAFGILVPQTGIEPGPSIVGVQSPNHQTTREFRTQDSHPDTTWKEQKKELYEFHFTCSGSRDILVLKFWKILSSLDSCFAMDSNSSSCASPEKSSTLLLWQQE